MLEGILALAATAGVSVAAGLQAKRASAERRPYLIAWTLALAALTLALAAMALGLLLGFGGVLFRAGQIGAALLAPIWLALGLVEVISHYVQVRFAAWLFGVSYSVVALVILLLDPLTGEFGDGMPDPRESYDSLPLLLIDGAHAVTVIVLVVCAGVTALRASRRDRAAYDVLTPMALISLAGVLLVSGSRGLLPGFLAILALGAAAGLVWYGTMLLSPQDPDRDFRPERDHDRAGRDDRHRGDRDDRHRGDYDYDPGYDADYAQADGGYDDYEEPVHGRHGQRGAERTGYDEQMYGQGQPMPHGAPGLDPQGAPDLCGQITVYTLLDGREAAFDRLAGDVVRAAHAEEPGVLIFTCHEVPNAPTQRIIYQLFRDQAAFAAHDRLPHVRRFAMESRTHVLATNIIELRLNTGKVVPLPAGEFR